MACFAATMANGFSPTMSFQTGRFSNYAILLTRARTPVTVRYGKAMARSITTTRLTFFTTQSVYAICYLLIRIAQPDFALPPDSRILFEEDWVPNREGIARAFEQLYKGRPAVLAP